MKKTYFRLIFLLSFNVLSFYTFSQITHWDPSGMSGGGAMFAPVISPYNGDEAWLSCDMSPMHRSTDFGATWSTLDFRTLMGVRATHVRFTNHPNWLYTLASSSNGMGYPAKSTDAGTTWKPLATNPCSITGYQLYTNPHDTAQVIVSDKNNVFYSTNGGTSWTTVYSVGAASSLHLAGVFCPGRDSLLICTDQGIQYTTNRGSSWTNTIPSITGIPAGEGIVNFRGAFQGGIIKLFAITIQSSKLTPRTYSFDTKFYTGLYEMNWGAAAWTSLNSTLAATDKVYLVELSPTDTSRVYLGGSALVSGLTLGTTFVSTNGGSSWTSMFFTPTTLTTNSNIVTAYKGKSSASLYINNWNGINTCDGLTVDPANNLRVMRSDGSCIHTTVNGGATWQQAYSDTTLQHPAGVIISVADEYKHNGLCVTACYWLTWLDSLNIFASYNDLMGIRTTNAGSTWSFNHTGLYVAAMGDINMTIHDKARNLLFDAQGEVPGSNGDYTDSRASMALGRLAYSTDGGANWQVHHAFGKPVSCITFDPTSSTRMYATVLDTIGGQCGVWVCNDYTLGASSVWNKVTTPNPVRTEGRPMWIEVLNDGHLVLVSGSRDISTTSTPSYTYSASSGIFYSTDGGTTWADRTGSGMDKSTENMVVDPNDPTQNTWLAFVTSNSSLNPGIYRTTDRGLGWTRIYNNAAFSATFHPAKANEMYICTTRNGLLYATGTNTFTPTITQDPYYPFRNPLRAIFNPYNSKEVWVASFGNGFRVGREDVVLAMDDPAAAPETPEVPRSVVYPNPSAGEFTFQLQEWNDQPVRILLYSAAGTQIMLDKTSLAPGEVSGSLNLTPLADGCYTLHLIHSDGHRDTHRLLIRH